MFSICHCFPGQFSSYSFPSVTLSLSLSFPSIPLSFFHCHSPFPSFPPFLSLPVSLLWTGRGHLSGCYFWSPVYQSRDQGEIWEPFAPFPLALGHRISVFHTNWPVNKQRSRGYGQSRSSYTAKVPPGCQSDNAPGNHSYIIRVVGKKESIPK